MADEQIEAAQARTSETRRAEWTAGLYLLLAGGVHTALGHVSELPVVRMAFVRVAWRLGKWPTLPLPGDPLYYHHSTLGDETILGVLIMIAGTTLSIAFSVGLLHGLVFGIAIILHKWFGWPRYWQDVRSKVPLRAVWAHSVRRSWWAWPVAVFVWMVLSEAAFAASYAFYPIINCGPIFRFANTASVCLIFGMVSARAVRTSLLQTLEIGDLRCVGCGYPLKGLPTPRCPECGSTSPEEAQYGLWLRRSRTVRVVIKPLSIASIVALLLAPVWVPLGILNMPVSWRVQLPEGLFRGIYNYRPDSFPISVDTTCVVEHGNSAAVIRIRKFPGIHLDYQCAYWSEMRELKLQKPPNSLSSARVKIPNLALPVGPWTFTYSRAGERVIWLTPPDCSFTVSAFKDDEAPEEFRFVVENWDEWER